jgi:hypothetical protein
VLAVVAAEQEHEVGEVGAEGFNAVGRAADEAFQRIAEMAMVGRESAARPGNCRLMSAGGTGIKA